MNSIAGLLRLSTCDDGGPKVPWPLARRIAWNWGACRRVRVWRSHASMSAGVWQWAVPAGRSYRNPNPARIQSVMDGPGKVRELTAGYKTATRTGDALDATADLEDVSGVSFHVHDVWRLKGDSPFGPTHGFGAWNGPGGFLTLLSSSTFRGPRAGMMLQLPRTRVCSTRIRTYDGQRSPGGTLNFAAHHLMLREDILGPLPCSGCISKMAPLSPCLDPTHVAIPRRRRASSHSPS